ncbi:hypothetical protein LIZ98_16805 [Caldibacillus sp. 210928-DFI.2.18]|uniref:hypothetical protein n=1 Tax=Caldibacillus sp. 210928-DFI.2.18 TaxID=2883264 RepID=UPI001D0752AC|nr:hypothetical protein [Caldibacillus sp. 210928-DFI.2.18]MCB7075022.1 hypothetical protein [Caldibacillus sp. 210928-DFI.2.18]
MVTRMNFVAKKSSFRASKRRREGASSPKTGNFWLKMVTRKGLFAKMKQFSPQSGDEEGSRRQKVKFSSKKRRREGASSPKTSNFRLKIVTRKGLVVKKWSFPPQNGDEKRSRRQKRAIFGLKW